MCVCEVEGGWCVVGDMKSFVEMVLWFLRLL